MKDKALIEALKIGDQDTLKAIYLKHKQAFIAFAGRYDLKPAEVLDVYQDAIIALRENAIGGKLDYLKNSLKTYLFSIGKYMIYKILKDKKRLYRIDDESEFENFTYELDFSTDLVEELTNEQQQLQKAYKDLGETCKNILTLFYYRSFTLEEIAQHLNYSNKDVVKSQKSRCLKTLKNVIFKSSL